MRDNLKDNKKKPEVKVGELVVIKGDEQNKTQERLTVIREVYPEIDEKVRAVRLRAGKLYLQWAIQHLNPLELSCDIVAPTQEHTINEEAEEFRPKRNVSKIHDLGNDYRERPFNQQHFITND